ncbi:MAG TPA: SIS domain-containing protein [Solirubrobacteraceae bacterium]|jgi:fructoselysine-6-P-deglycase FrlB-like protein|nr:SIS domain-containing protein [Solirubrobacteraceae bacterium]
MRFVEQEIRSQPECWREAAALAASDLVRAQLPADQTRVAVVGCGTSLFMAHACARLREDAGAGETDVFPASEFPHARRYDHVVALTRSGTTTEVLQLLGSLPAGTASTVITTDDDLPVARLARETIPLAFADERSVVQTRFATTTLALWRAWLGEDIEALATGAERVLSVSLPDDVLDAARFTFVGSGWAAGIANEAALKARESAQLWTESYPAMELRHGPISVLDPESVAWIFGRPPAGLIDDIAATGAVVVSSDEDPMVDLVRAQRFAVAVAERRGLDPDAPRNLTRSIVLPGEL